MLVLTRHIGEGIAIGRDIEVRVVGLRGRRVRLAIDAPLGVHILRDELQPRLAPEAGIVRLRPLERSHACAATG